MSPIDIEDILERARNSARVGDHEQAERLLKKYLASVPDSRDARLLLGTTYAGQGKLPEAADEFIALLAKNPQDLEALNNAAVISRRQDNLPEALEYLKEAIDVDPVRAEFHYNIGNIHKQLGNSKAALMAYSKVIELDPSYVPAYNNLGTIYEQSREYEKAYNIFRKGLALDNNNPTLHFNYGVALEANGRLEEAAAEYRAALRSKPGWLEPMNNLGIILFKQGRHDKALATFNRILHADPFNAEAYNNMGVVQADQGKTREAVRNYRRALEADPRYAKAVVNLERALESSGDFSDALIELEKLVKLSPDSADIRTRLAGLYLKMERYPEALEQAEAALQWEPNSVQALRIQGAAQRILGNDTEAQASFEKILSIDPGNYNYLLDLADIHFRRKEYREAEERLQAFLIRRPNDRNAKLLLGRLYAEMGNRSHAVQIFEELAKADPNDTEALAAAAELHKKAGSIEKALRTADTLVNVQGKRATANDLTELNKSLEFYENAVNAYSSSVREMWDRNIRLMGGEEEEDSGDEDLSLLMDAAGVSLVADEETESLFIESMENSFAEEDEGDIVFDDVSPGEIPEEAELPVYQDPLDALAETVQGPVTASSQPAASGPFPNETPDSPPEPAPEEPLPRTKPEPPPEESAPFPVEDEEELPLYDASEEDEDTGVPEETGNAGAAPTKKTPLKKEPRAADSAPPEPVPDDEELEENPVTDEEFPEDEPGEENLYTEAGFPEDELPEEIPEQETPLPVDETEPEDEAAFDETPPFADEIEPEDEAAFDETPPFAGEIEPEDEAAFDETPETETQPFTDKIEPEAAEEEAADIPDSFETTAPEQDDNSEIAAIVELLKCLKGLTEVLPPEERESFSRGKFPAVLESVIDSLTNLAIMEKPEEDTDSGTAGAPENTPGQARETLSVLLR